jgi:hypothetical protein
VRLFSAYSTGKMSTFTSSDTTKAAPVLAKGADQKKGGAALGSETGSRVAHEKTYGLHEKFKKSSKDPIATVRILPQTAFGLQVKGVELGEEYWQWMRQHNQDPPLPLPLPQNVGGVKQPQEGARKRPAEAVAAVFAPSAIKRGRPILKYLAPKGETDNSLIDLTGDD